MPIKYEMIENEKIDDLTENIKIKHLSNREVADQLGVSRQRFYNYIFHRRMPEAIYNRALDFVKTFSV